METIAMCPCCLLLLGGWPFNSSRRGGGDWLIREKSNLQWSFVQEKKILSRYLSWKKRADMFRDPITQNVTQEKNYHTSTSMKKKFPVEVFEKKKIIFIDCINHQITPPSPQMSNGRPPKLCWPGILLGFVAVLLICFIVAFLFNFGSWLNLILLL